MWAEEWAKECLAVETGLGRTIPICGCGWGLCEIQVIILLIQNVLVFSMEWSKWKWGGVE